MYPFEFYFLPMVYYMTKWFSGNCIIYKNNELYWEVHAQKTLTWECEWKFENDQAPLPPLQGPGSSSLRLLGSLAVFQQS